jgi:tRNA modification GTPase
MSTIAAIATPNAAGGIGIVRLSGEDAVEIAAKCFYPFSGRDVGAMKGYTAAYGAVRDGETELDDGVLLVYRAPRSYTGENVAEICCHGGLYVLQQTLRLVLKLGAVPAGPGEFTQRAFLNGKMDLSQAEGVMNVISAQGDSALRAARSALRGDVSKKVEAIASTLVAAAAALAAWTDYPDDDVPAVENAALGDAIKGAADRLRGLIRDYDNGKAVTRGVKTAICGKPNVGKSTLMNLLSGCKRSIVTPISGTTRDVVEETVRLGDLTLRLMDTAGIRDTDDPVERLGVALAREKLEEAELVLCVFDGSCPFDEADEAMLEAVKSRRCLAVVNKADLPLVFDLEKIRAAVPDAVVLSANDPDALAVLQAAAEKLLGVGGLDFNQELLATERQRACCETALEALEDALSALDTGLTVDAVSVDIDCAVDALLTLTGKKASDEIVSEVFRSFCVGK